MDSYFVKDFCIRNGDSQNLKVKHFLNKLCGMKSDDIVNVEFTFGIVNDAGQLKFFIRSDNNFTDIIKQQFLLMYDDVEFEDMNYNLYKERMINDSSFSKLRLKYNNTNVDCKITTTEPNQIFIENLLNALYSKDNYDLTIIEISLKPYDKESLSLNKSASNKILSTTLKGVEFLIESLFYNDNNVKINNSNIKTNNKDKEVDSFKYMVSINIGLSNNQLNDKLRIRKIRNIESVFSQLNNQNKFISSICSYNDMFNSRYNMILSSDEIYQFVYLPTNVTLGNVIGSSDVTILVDKNVPNKGIFIGSYNNNEYYIATPDDVLTKENYSSLYLMKSKFLKSDINNSLVIDNLCKTRLIEGLPGTGKSEIITNLAISGLHRGLPFILIDPKYDTQKRIIESVPDKFLNKIDFLDLGDMLYPPALNIFRRRKENDATENTLITTNFLSYMRKQFDRNWGYNIERMIQMTTDAVLLDDITTISEFYWMLTEEEYRKTIIEIIKSKLSEPNVDNKSRLKQLLKYWDDYQARYAKNPITVNKEIETVMNKIGVFIGNRFINAIVSQRDSYDFKKSGDMARSVIINIPEGLISQDNMSLLSGFVTKAIWADYQSRDDMDISKRYPVQWLIDEASTVVDDEIVGIMQKARSRRLGLSLITQTLASLNMRGANIGDIIADNCKTKLIYKIGSRDASSLMDEFPQLSIKDFTDCPDHHFYGKILLPNGRVSNPFFAKSPNLHPVIRDYDSYKREHQSGRMTITEIENDIDLRLERFTIANML